MDLYKLKAAHMTDFQILLDKVSNKVNRYIDHHYPLVSEKDTFSREMCKKIVRDVVFDILAGSKPKC